MKQIQAPHLATTVKMGRKRPVAVGPHFRLRNFLRASLPPAPATCDYGGPAAAILADVMLNDQLGDCVVAGGYHIAGVATANAGNPFHATKEQIVKDYSAIGGYVPGNPGTDNGCDEVTALNYWTQHGFANGTKLLGWMSIDATNKAEVMHAIHLFENCYFGVELPDGWISPFPAGNGFTWDVVGPPDRENGHCFVSYAYDQRGPTIDTWGMKGTVTWEAVAKYACREANGELYVLLTPDMLAKGQAKAPNGLAWLELITAFNAMGGHVPVPAPTPVTPPVHASVSLSAAQEAVRHALDQEFALLTRSRAEYVALDALKKLPW